MTLKQLIRPRWQIGIVENSLEGIVNGEELRVQWPANPFHDRWFADPFVLSVNGNEVTLLVEDFRYKDGKGRISRIIVDMERNSIVSCKTILDGGHYSFPAIMRYEGKVYFYPEQSRQGKLELFEYCPATETCEYVETLSDESLTDAIIYKGVIYSTRLSEPNGKTLKMFKWPSAVQEFKHETRNSTLGSAAFEVVTEKELETRNSKLETFSFSECIARNAGDFFECGGKVYRPAQECNRWHGNALSIQLYENGEFKEVRRIPRLHTLNSYQAVTVVDRKIFPFKWVYRLLRKSDK
jgi:hypothetical protein